jgi:hypothetical protein
MYDMRDMSERECLPENDAASRGCLFFGLPQSSHGPIRWPTAQSTTKLGQSASGTLVLDDDAIEAEVQ